MTRSVDDIRRDSERNRAQLAQTVDSLRGKISDTADDIRHKVSAEYIKEEVSGYLADTRRDWINALKQQAMDNPMQAVAAGMAIAVPALRIARSIPLPLLMIGAGLALTSKRVRNALSDAMPAANDIGAQVDAATQGVTDGVKSLQRGMQEAAGNARDAISQKAQDIGQSVADIANHAGDAVAEFQASAKDRVQSGVSAIASQGRDVAEAVRTKVASIATGSTESAEGFVRDHAVLVGALGVGVGAMIAASLPATRAESSALGPASDQIKRTASDAVETGFDMAKDAVTAAVGDVGRKFGAADLPADVSRVTGDVTQKLKTVADKAVTTAFEPSHNEQR